MKSKVKQLLKEVDHKKLNTAFLDFADAYGHFDLTLEEIDQEYTFEEKAVLLLKELKTIENIKNYLKEC